MAIGRLKRGKRGTQSGLRHIHVDVVVQRAFRMRGVIGGYEARACFRTTASTKWKDDEHEGRSPVLSCGEYQSGRTPQSAVAKALKDFAQTVALRNPGKHTGAKLPRWYVKE